MRQARLNEAAGLLVVGLAGTRLLPEHREVLARGVLGVILFGRNVESPEQVARFVAELKEAAGRPLLVAVDQEGGVVRRLRPGFSEVPSMRAVGSARDPALAYRLGRILGRELRAVGIDLNLAPVLDVDSNLDNPVIGSRSFGADAAWVGALGVALGRGIESEGVGSTAKHFPGHGDTALDSHLALPRVTHGLERLEQVELLPFRAWAQAGLAAVMTAHVVFDALDPERPATLSERIMTDLLREQLGYEGVVLSDALEMRAIADRHGPAEAGLLAVEAGVDVLLACSPDQPVDELALALEQARATRDGFEQRFQRARSRAQTLVARFCRPPEPPALDRLSTSDARALIQRLAQLESMGTGIDPTARGGAA